MHHITHVVRQFPPSIGGLEEVVARLSAQQLSKGFHVKIITLDRIFATGERLPPREHRGGVEVVRIPFRGSTRYPIAPSVLGLLGDTDIVHVHGVDFFFDFLAWTARIHRRPLIATTHGGFFHTRNLAAVKRVWFGTMTRVSARAYQALIACSAADEALFRRLGSDNVSLIENGVAIDRFGAASATPRKGIVSIGRFSANKRHDRLLASFAAVVQRDPEFKLFILGASSDQSPEDVRRSAAGLGIGANVDVRANLSDAEVAAVVAQASLFVSASEYEGFGLTLVEALGAGLRPIVHHNGAFNEFQKRHGGVTLTDFAQPEQAADRILDVWHQCVERPAGATEEAKRVAARFSWPAAAASYEAIYCRALSRSIPPHS